MKTHTSRPRKKPSLLKGYISLMRLNKPIGIYLVMWPALWGLWLASDLLPDIKLIVIFIVGAVVMRSAGCVINDYADRKIDGRVKRTAMRPIAAGVISSSEALVLFGLLLIIGLMLVLLTNMQTVMWSFGAVILATIYPFMKRYTHMPQLFLGAAFAWAIPMAFTAQSESLPPALWLVYTAVVLWAVTYDTFYAMVDRDDDLKIGVKSTAILFGDADKIMTACLQLLTLLALALAGERFELGLMYKCALLIVSLLFIYQQYLIKDRDPHKCFQAFLNNNWVGMVIFLGIVLDKLELI